MEAWKSKAQVRRRRSRPEVRQLVSAGESISPDHVRFRRKQQMESSAARVGTDGTITGSLPKRPVV